MLNLEDVSHFNHAFGKVIGVKKQEKVLKELTKFKRKIKIEEDSPKNKGYLENKNNKVKYSNLK